MDFSWCLNQNQFSDCTLIIVPDNTASDILQAPVRCTLCHVIDDAVRKQVLGRYNVHRVILATASAYFKALFDEKWNDGQNSVIQLTVQKDEKSAAEIMLHYIYSGTVVEADEHKLLDCMILANRYQVNNCVASCADSLTKAGIAGMSMELMMRVLSLPTVLKQVAEFRSLLAAAESKLIHLYGDMEEAWRSGELRRLFVSLPCDAVKLLAESDQLRVASENVMFVAVASWLMFNRAHELCGSNEVFELLDCIRLVQLSTTFLCDIAHNIKMFADCFGFQVGLRQALQYRLSTPESRRLLGESLIQHWLVPRARSPVQQLSFGWELDVAAVKSALRQLASAGGSEPPQPANWFSAYQFFAGVFWRLNVCVQANTGQEPDMDNSSSNPTSDVFVGIGWETRFEGSEQVRQVGTLGMRVKYEIRPLVNPPEGHEVQEQDECTIDDGDFFGIHHFFGYDVYDADRAWDKFVKDGRLHIHCCIQECD